MISSPEQLFTTERTRFLRIATTILRNNEDAEDCVQEAFLYIWKAWGAQDPAKVLPWATSVVWNRGLTMLRRKRAGKRFAKAESVQDLAPLEQPTVPSHEGMVIAKLTIVAGTRRLSPGERRGLAQWVRGERRAHNAAATRARQRVRSIIG
jgi:RNA polymerase sigma factor (sigma-70 family)